MKARTSVGASIQAVAGAEFPLSREWQSWFTCTLSAAAAASADRAPHLRTCPTPPPLAPVRADALVLAPEAATTVPSACSS